MLELPEPRYDIEEWLSTLRLSQYISFFQEAGYEFVEDCRGLTDERLLELQVVPTGHRKRILRSLEALGLKHQGGEKDESEQKVQQSGGDQRKGESYQHNQTKENKEYNLEGSQSLPAGAGLGPDPEDFTDCRRAVPPVPAPRDLQLAQTSVSSRTGVPTSTLLSSSDESLSTSEIPSDWEVSSEEPCHSSYDSVSSATDILLPVLLEDQEDFDVEMVENSIYEAQPEGPRLTRSYRLRHRPVPEIPIETAPPPIDRKNFKEKECPPAPDVPHGDDYSTVDMCASLLPRANLDAASALTPDPAPAVSPDISPYACFYGAPKQQVVKVGWLDKLSPQGNCVFQRRWVRFDGESLAYYNNEKVCMWGGGGGGDLINVFRIRNKFIANLVCTYKEFDFMLMVQTGERKEWMETLQTATRPPASSSQKPSDSLPHLSSTNKRGLLELRGYKGRVLVSLVGSKVRLCKTEQDFRAGLGICEVELTAANIKEVDRRGFEINTPFKNFCFVVDSEREKEEWVEAIKESIAETLYDYEVAEKIWFNEANRSCADCGALEPEWASVNLGVVICKKCAGQHRSLGPSISKIRSLKLDSSIWSNELVELFLEVGNKNANSFWAANLALEEELHSMASAEQRATFIRRKYRERKYRKVLEEVNSLEELNQALCAAVVSSDVLKTMELVFSGADVMCATGDPVYSTPYLLAQRAGQKLQMEFLHQNKLCDFPRLDQWSESASLSDVSLFMDGFLYVSFGPAKMMLDGHMARRWCTLEGGFLSYYENERSPSAIGRVDVTEVVSLAVSNSETMTGAGAVFTAELYLRTERALTVGAETQDTQHDWIQALTKCFVPTNVEGLVRKDSELIGRLQYKEGHDLYHWRTGWFMLEGSALHFTSGDEEGAEEALNLKQLQELSEHLTVFGENKIQVLLMVESGRTLYIHGFNRMDFSVWHEAITLAAGTDGRALGDQQLTKNGVPIIVDSCIAFVTQYGLCQEGVYQTPGDPVRVSLLLEEFTRDARNVKLRNKEHQLEDVTDTLKSFLSQAEDALLTKELYPYWVSALDEEEEKQRVKKYSTFIESLPRIYRSTLHALLQHLYRIQQCSHLNGMPSEKLAAVFSCCLFQTQGQTPQEISVIRDLISNYVTLFSVNEDQVQQMETENSFITRWNEKKDAAVSRPTQSFVFPSTERPLHHSEKILEQVLEWSTLDCPSSAFLVIKKFAGAKRMSGGKGRVSVSSFSCLFSLFFVQNTKAEKEIQLKMVKCYLGLKKKLKPPTK
uniref:Arf-GAP with Rho-GAP domain, ANK repeat and PH domain-containing protein 2 n=1 Tax=Fundulus heteroclitus TaxID=8078 RepID=A0A3Q2QSQ4_FUNHE